MTKGALKSGSSSWAQGGIAAVLSGTDSVQSHVDDTFVAGAGLCNLAATRFVVEQAPQAIVWLRELGVPFSLEYGELHRTVRPFRRLCSRRCAAIPTSRCSRTTPWST